MVPISLGLWPPATLVPINGHHGAHWVAYGVNFSPSHGQDYGHALPKMGCNPAGSHAWALPCPFLACFVGTALPVPKMGTGCPSTTVMVSISRHPIVGTGSPFWAGGTVQPTHGHHRAHRHLKMARKSPEFAAIVKCALNPKHPNPPSGWHPRSAHWRLRRQTPSRWMGLLTMLMTRTRRK